jgi:adenosylhomocysteinase
VSVLERVRDRLRGRRVAVDDPDLAEVLAEAGAEVNVSAPEVVIEAQLVRVGEAAISTREARCARLFDAGQSVVNAVFDATNLLAADKNAVVVGYDRGGANRLRGLGARVTVCDTDPLAALEAYCDGYDIAPLVDACRTADLVIGPVGEDALAVLPDGALLTGHDVEARAVRDQVGELVLDDGRSLFLVSAPAVEPTEAKDLRLALLVLSAAYLLEHGRNLEPGVQEVPAELDEEIARLKLGALGVRI